MLFDCRIDPSAAGSSFGLSCPDRTEGASHVCDYSPLRRVERNPTIQLTSKVNETLVPKLNKLPGFAGYYLIEAGHGVFSSLNLFETREQARSRRSSSPPDPRGEARHDAPERAQDHERPGRRAQRPVSWSPRSSSSTIG